MLKIISSTKIPKNLDNNELYYWENLCGTEILHLGTMKKAVVIREKMTKKEYFISESSFFPFSNEVYSMRFNDIEQAKNLAITVIGTWLQNTINSLN